MDPRRDEALVAEYLAGDEESFRVLVERHLGSLYNFAFRYVGNRGDAEDIAQDAFMRAWKSIRTFDSARPFRTWLFAITKNAALNWIKKKKPSLFSELDAARGEDEEPFEELIPDESPLPEELFSHAHLGESLGKALMGLSPAYRVVLSLYYEEHYTLREIAEILGESADTVKSRHRRALRQLRGRITRQ